MTDDAPVRGRMFQMLLQDLLMSGFIIALAYLLATYGQR